jgi:hypothetical protein
MTDNISPFVRSMPPSGAWEEILSWDISSNDEAAAVRGAAATLIGSDHDNDSERPVFAASGARVETVLGELIANGLRHGEPPVHASLSRAGGAWLLVVSDAATEHPPQLRPEFSGPTRNGGLGLRLVLSLAADVGWHADDTSKHVWALIGDEAPAHLIATLAAHDHRPDPVSEYQKIPEPTDESTDKVTEAPVRRDPE